MINAKQTVHARFGCGKSRFQEIMLTIHASWKSKTSITSKVTQHMLQDQGKFVVSEAWHFWKFLVLMPNYFKLFQDVHLLIHMLLMEDPNAARLILKVAQEWKAAKGMLWAITLAHAAVVIKSLVQVERIAEMVRTFTFTSHIQSFVFQLTYWIAPTLARNTQLRTIYTIIMTKRLPNVKMSVWRNFGVLVGTMNLVKMRPMIHATTPMIVIVVKETIMTSPLEITKMAMRKEIADVMVMVRNQLESTACDTGTVTGINTFMLQPLTANSSKCVSYF